MLRLKSLTLESPVIQSPMAGCSDLPFRLIGREHGMELAFLEMISAEALIRGTEESQELMKRLPQEKPLGAQLVGCNPNSMAEAAKIIEDQGYDVLDLNMGCPVPKITGKGAGSALLTRPNDCREIFSKVVKATQHIPVTVKMRIGYEDPSGDEALAVAKIAEEEGLAGVCVHGRTRAQRYMSPIHAEAIKKVKEGVKIPVTGNGDIYNEQDALKMVESTGCDGVVLGRGALGNPWIYPRIQAALAGKKIPPPPNFEEVRRTLLRHLELEIEHYGERYALLQMRRVGCWYFSRMPGVAEFRTKINVCDGLEKMRDLIQKFNPLLTPCTNT